MMTCFQSEKEPHTTTLRLRLLDEELLGANETTCAYLHMCALPHSINRIQIMTDYYIYKYIYI